MSKINTLLDDEVSYDLLSADPFTSTMNSIKKLLNKLRRQNKITAGVMRAVFALCVTSVFGLAKLLSKLLKLLT